MAFPINPADGDAHVEGSAAFYASGGRWRSDRGVDVRLEGGADVGSGANSIAPGFNFFSTVKNEGHRKATSMIRFTSDFQLDAPSHVGLTIYSAAGGNWYNFNPTDATGIVDIWSAGYQIKNWFDEWAADWRIWLTKNSGNNQANWAGAAPYMNSLELFIMKSGSSHVHIAFEMRSQVSSSGPSIQKVQMRQALDFDDIGALGLSVATAKFATGRATAEWF